MIAAMYVSSAYFQFSMEEFSMVGGYMEDLKSLKTPKTITETYY